MIPYENRGILDAKKAGIFRLTLIGGDEENRTPDPLLARQVLSQLSYTPGLSGAAFPPFSFTLEVSFGAFKIKQHFSQVELRNIPTLDV